MIPIAGLEKCSLIDFPGMISAVLFTQGCNFRCGYCHNPELVLPNRFSTELYPLHAITDYIEDNLDMLDAIVITGGEPTIHKNLPDFLQELRKFPLKIKLDTNGTCPQMIKELLDKKLVDFIAMDMKHILEEKYYLQISSMLPFQCVEKMTETAHYISSSSVGHEFRTTFIPGIHTTEIIKELKHFAGQLKVQAFKNDSTLDKEYALKSSVDEIQLQSLQKI